MKLLTIILNYRTPELAKEALTKALRASESVRDSRIVVVDNDSRDGSIATLRRAVHEGGVEDRAEVIPSEYNGGFGYGNNFAIRRAMASDDVPEYFYLLNSDAFPTEDALAELVSYMDAHPDVGIVGSFVEGVDGKPHQTAFRFPSVLSELEHAMQLGVLSKLLSAHVVPLPIPERDLEVDWVSGASMMLRRTMLEEIGLFDESYFLYFEETDLCRRAKLAGWPVVYVPTSRVAHVGSASTGIQDLWRRKPTFWFDSRQRYFRKNHGLTYLWLANAAQLGGGLVFRMRRFLQRQRDVRPVPERFLRDLVGHMASSNIRSLAQRTAGTR